MRKMKRRRAQENPSTQTVLVIGGGLALVGVAAYLYFKNKAPAATTPAVTAAASTLPQLTTGSQPFGNPADSNSVAYACNTAWKLTALGHPKEAAYWAPKCTAGGGTIPTSAAQQYT